MHILLLSFLYGSTLDLKHRWAPHIIIYTTFPLSLSLACFRWASRKQGCDFKMWCSMSSLTNIRPCFHVNLHHASIKSSDNFVEGRFCINVFHHIWAPHYKLRFFFFLFLTLLKGNMILVRKKGLVCLFFKE